MKEGEDEDENEVFENDEDVDDDMKSEEYVDDREDNEEAEPEPEKDDDGDCEFSSFYKEEEEEFGEKKGNCLYEKLNKTI